MRTFIAIELPDELKKKISDFQRNLKKQDILDGNWTKNYHLTLKFLGEVNEGKLKDVVKVLAEIASKTKRFELEFKNLGAFPSQSYVRVLWVGTGAGDEEALVLHEEIDNSLTKLDFEKEKEYTNHLTICRVKAVSDKKKLKEILETKVDFGKFPVSEFKLIKSSLTEKGPVYESLKTFKLV